MGASTEHQTLSLQKVILRTAHKDSRPARAMIHRPLADRSRISVELSKCSRQYAAISECRTVDGLTAVPVMIVDVENGYLRLRVFGRFSLQVSGGDSDVVYIAVAATKRIHCMMPWWAAINDR